MGSEPREDPRRGLVDLPVLHKFKLYSTRTHFYLFGRDEKKTFWRILKIDRTDPTELNLFEDHSRYTHDEIVELKKWLSRGNQKYGGLKAVTNCYGIIGFVKFLGPYYMLVIKERKKLGEICGHAVYSVAKSQMITIPSSSNENRVADSSAERRYKNLLNMVDLSKNFYFSYTYHLMYCLQKNIRNTEKGKLHDNTMFVWNEYLTHGIRGILKNTVWTVALVYGFFQQTKCSVSKEEFLLTVIARRSRHYAGTRYLTRGVNEAGHVANEVEVEQIVCREVPKDQKIPITSVVQVRGSIPLFWSQETSKFNAQPDIIFKNKDRNYMATRLHFENLRQRYGKRIIILNLLKQDVKSQRESILLAEFRNAIWYINKRMMKENILKPYHIDLTGNFKKSGIDGAFEQLCSVGKEALTYANLFYCKAPSGIGTEGVLNDSFFSNPIPNQDAETSSQEDEDLKADISFLQFGVLRTNCIDCLDRTNFAQYAYGLVALAHQLQRLGITGPPIVDKNNPMARKLMEVYVNIGGAIAKQYTGSEAHIKMFGALRGDSNMMVKHRDMITAVVRYFRNSYQDSEKQNAINVFLGQSGPQLRRPAAWEELRSGKHNTEKTSANPDIENLRPRLLRSFSDNLLLEGEKPEELALENPQPSREVDYEDELDSLSLLSAIRGEDHLIGRVPSQMFPGSSSTSDSQDLDDIPGFGNSYDTSFTPAEDMFERSSSMSSDNMLTDLDESVTSGSNVSLFPSSWNALVPGYSNDFCQWVGDENAPCTGR